MNVRKSLPAQGDRVEAANLPRNSIDWKFASLLGKQEWYWRQKSPLTIEELISTSPTTLTDEHQLSLICQEVFLRESAGERPTLEEYQRRFEHLASAIAIQWELDHLLCPVEELPGNCQGGCEPCEPATEIDGAAASLDMVADRYAIQSRLGAGGMGVVYKALDSRLQRIVALKLITSRAVDRGALPRFRREAELIASVNSPYIVPIYDTGESRSGPYIAMEFCPAGTLSDLLGQGTIAARVAADIVRQTALGIEAAHQVSVVHRDLKPGNILLANHPSSTGASVQVKVTDFGLAKRIDVTDHDTETGELMGTPGYLAPEQLVGVTSTKLPLVDVYALGAILYECLTGRPPVRGATHLETLKLLATQEPVPLRTLQPDVPVDLATIAHKCLQPNPDDRYSSAGDVADDLQRFMLGESIRARPTPFPVRIWKWTRRNPVVASLVATVFLSLTIGLLASLSMYRAASQNAERARQNADFATQTVYEYFSEVAENPELKLVGLESLRRDLLAKAQRFYQQLPSSSENSPKFSNVAETHFRLASISAELGDLAMADEQYQRAVSAYRESLPSQADGPLHDQVQRAVALGLKGRAIVQFRMADVSLGEELLQESIGILRELKERTTSPNDIVQLAGALSELGQQLSSPERGEEQKKVFDEVEQLCILVQPHQTELEPERAIELLAVYDQLALNWQTRNLLDAAVSWFSSSRDLAQSLLTKDQRNPTVRFSLARSHKGLQLAFGKQQKFEDSIREFEAADKEFDSLCADHPLVLSFLDGRATSAFNQGTVLFRAGQAVQAREILNLAMGLQKQLVQKQPDSFEAHNALGLFCSTLATVLLQQDDVVTAESTVLSGLESARRAQILKPDDVGVTYFSAALENTSGLVFQKLGKLPEAIAAFERAGKPIAELYELDKSKLPFGIFAATANRNLCNVSRLNERFDLADTAGQTGLRILGELLQQNSTLADALTIKADLELAIGELRFAQGNYRAAAQLGEDAYKSIEAVQSTSQAPERFHSVRAQSSTLIGRSLAKLQEHAKAVEWCELATTAYLEDIEFKQSKGTAAELERASDGLANCYLATASSLLELEQFAAAEEAARAAMNQPSRVQAAAEELLRQIENR